MQVHQTLELALSMLDQDPNNRMYMCCHLDWMARHKYIAEAACDEAKAVIYVAIDGETTLAAYLRWNNAMPKGVAVLSDEYRHYQLTFYRWLISKLRAADPMHLIIEAAYHCAHSNGEIHAAVKAAGLPEIGDETIANLLGEYAESIKE